MKKFFAITFIAVLSSLTAFAEMNSTYWSENFEGNWSNDWYADFGVWQVGTPSIGPGSAFEGNNCATVGLTENYPSTFDSKFIKINSITIPDASQNPRLRFRHWWSIADSDYGVVQIKESGSSVWIPVSPNYSGTGGNVWNHAFIDLTAYAGKTVQLAFHFHSANNYVGPGWYIDEVSIETGQVNFSLPEGFETGMGDWYSDFGSWQVGTPSIGPGAAHQGTNCATVGLNFNYQPTFDSKLISPAFLIPDASQNPRLRFWHWWSIADSDYGVVQIKESGSSVWIPVSPNYGGTGGNVWNHAFIDLTAYAGKTVQLAFHFHSANNYVGPGWYIDDVSIETGQVNFSLPEGFETGMGDWYSDFGSWQAGTPSIGPGAAHQGTNCATVGLNFNYQPTFNSKLISPAFTIPDAWQNPRLRFWHWWSIADSDYGVVQIKESGSTVWTAISPNYSGTGGNIWNHAFIDLTAYAGKTVQLAFHFHSANNYVGPGWYIDDINIETIFTGISNDEKFWTNANELHIVPNPAQKLISIEFLNPQHDCFELNIYDANGKPVLAAKSITGDRTEVDTGPLSPGVYTVTLSGKKVIYGKLVKQ